MGARQACTRETRSIVVYADRYAPDQFEAHVPTHLRTTELVATGGVAGSVVSRHRSVRLATRIQPVGLVADERGRPAQRRRLRA